MSRGLLPATLTPPTHPTFPASQQAKRLPPPAISLRSKSMTSELEEMGEPVGPAEGQGRPGARGWTTLDFVSVVSHEGSLSSSCPAPPPCPWARVRGLPVCHWKDFESLLSALLYLCFSVLGLWGCVCVLLPGASLLLSPPTKSHIPIPLVPSNSAISW